MLPLPSVVVPVIALSFTVLAGCAVEEARVAERGRSDLTGLSKSDLLMCAGHPSATDKAAGGEIWMYEHGAVDNPGVTYTPILPVGGLSFGQGGGRYCRVQIRLRRDTVSEVAYAGATDLIGGKDAVCAPIIKACVERRDGRR